MLVRRHLKKVKKKNSTKKNSESSSTKKELRLPKWWSNSCFLDSVIACLFFRENPYLINRLLKSRVQPFTLKEKKRIGDNRVSFKLLCARLFS